MGLFSKLADGVKKTRASMKGKLDALFGSASNIDEDLFDDLEELLITCDVGAETSLEITSRLRSHVKENRLTEPSEAMDGLKGIITDMLGEDIPLNLTGSPSVILVVGVNGSGKTTTVGKLAAKLTGEGKKVLVAAADTVRAAATDQLQIWVERAGAGIVKHREGSDPAAVVFDALTAAQARGADVLICDTAGRLHNKKHLMDELKKINRVISERGGDCSVETLLVLDATTGQNAVSQARLFSEAASVTGIALTKLDGTAKGGVVISIRKEIGIPVKLVTLGENIGDLQDFSGKDFAAALFDAPEKEPEKTSDKPQAAEEYAAGAEENGGESGGEAGVYPEQPVQKGKFGRLFKRKRDKIDDDSVREQQ
jgi:fused signal recognition particle receptor